jgi:hypothetical protein
MDASPTQDPLLRSLSVHSWVSYKRLSAGRFRFWPSASDEASTERVAAHELQVLLMGGDPARAQVMPAWRQVG